MIEKSSLQLFILILTLSTGLALECVDPYLKVTVKTSEPEKFDANEQYLFKGVMAYSIRKHCSAIENLCNEQQTETDIVNVKISNQTERFAMCVQVDNCPISLVQDAIRTSQPRFNGALMQTDDTLLYDGVPVTLKPEVEPAFPTWLIPFIVFIALVIIAAIAIISYTIYKSKKKNKASGDNESLTNTASENGVYSYDDGTITAM